MENGVLRNHFRVECEPHFFSPHGQANRANFKCTTKTSILIYNLINQNTRQVCGYQESTRTSDKFVGTKMWDITAVFSPPALRSSILTWLSSTAPALQLSSGASFLAGHLLLRLMLPPQWPKGLLPFWSQDLLLLQAHRASCIRRLSGFGSIGGPGEGTVLHWAPPAPSAQGPSLKASFSQQRDFS